MKVLCGVQCVVCSVIKCAVCSVAKCSAQCTVQCTMTWCGCFVGSLSWLRFDHPVTPVTWWRVSRGDKNTNFFLDKFTKYSLTKMSNNFFWQNYQIIFCKKYQNNFLTSQVIFDKNTKYFFASPLPSNNQPGEEKNWRYRPHSTVHGTLPTHRKSESNGLKNAFHQEEIRNWRYLYWLSSQASEIP